MSEAQRDEIQAPALSLEAALREATGLLELPRLALELRNLQDEPRGDGSSVLVLPGFGANDRSTWPLRQFLRGRGYRVRGWGRGSNRADVQESVENVGEQVRRQADRSGGPVALVGWSLGGYIAREVARDEPAAVRQVVTLGSPVIGGPKYTTVARFASAQGWDLDDIEEKVAERKQVPLRVPVTAIYSRQDRVVAWRACVDGENGAPVEHVEVEATHVGLGFSADVYRIVARRLARRTA